MFHDIDRFRRNLECFVVSFIATIAVGLLVAQRYQHDDIKTQLDSGNFAVVEKVLRNIEGKAFCNNLNKHMSAYAVLVEEQNTVTQFYNDAVLRQPKTGDRRSWAKLERQHLTAADINGLVFIAHINPWLDCARRYRIYHEVY